MGLENHSAHVSSKAVKISIFKSLSDALHTPQVCKVDTPAPHYSELLCSRYCNDRHYIKASEYIITSALTDYWGEMCVMCTLRLHHNAYAQGTK